MNSKIDTPELLSMNIKKIKYSKKIKTPEILIDNKKPLSKARYMTSLFEIIFVCKNKDDIFII